MSHWEHFRLSVVNLCLLGALVLNLTPLHAFGGIKPSIPAVAYPALDASLSTQPFDIDKQGFYLLPERLLENTRANEAPRYLMKTNPSKDQLILEFPFAYLKKGLPQGYAVGMQNIEKVELAQQNGSLIDLARVTITYKKGTNLKTCTVKNVSNGRLMLPYALSVTQSESQHGGGVIEDTQSPNYAKTPIPSPSEPPSLSPKPKPPSSETRTVIEVLEVEDEFFLLRPANNATALKVKNQFYLEKPNRFILDIEPASLSPQLFTSEADSKGKAPSAGVTEWRGWAVRISQNTPTVVRVVIETEDTRNFEVLQGQNNTFKNSLIIQPLETKETFWTKGKPPKLKSMGTLKQLYISKEIPQAPIKFRLESEHPLQYRMIKENERRFSLNLLNVEAPPEPVAFDVSAFPYLKSLSHVQAAQGSRLTIELNTPYADLRTTPYTASNALELSFRMVIPKPVVVKPTPPSNLPRGRKIVVIDAGHGGKDAGAIRDNVIEKDLNLSVALKVRNELQARGYTVYMTRSTDAFLSLKAITEVAASYRPDVFVSIHHNSSTNPSIYGLETYYYHPFSLNLAKSIHAKQVAALPVVDRGVRRNQFYVINHTVVPSVLCELGYVSNPTESRILSTDARQKQQARAIADGVDAYLKRGGN